MLLLQHRLHRLEHTVTTAGDVGAKVLARAMVDADASFLPSLPPSLHLTPTFLKNIPSTVNQALHVAVGHSTGSSSSSSSVPARIDEEQEEVPDADRGLDDSEGQKSGRKFVMAEQLLQDSYNGLFPYLLNAVQSGLHFHDTSIRNYLTCPTGKIDVTLTASGYVTWPDVVSFAELKPSLLSKPAYHVAVGQVIQRCQDIFELQTKRVFIVAMVMDGTHIDVLKISRAMPLEVTHTGRVPFGWSLQSVGLMMLLRLLASSRDQLGFVSPLVPEPFNIPLPANKRMQRGTCTVQNFIPLRIGSLSHRVSAVYLASCPLWPGNIVVKFSPASESGAHEAGILSQLYACSSSNPCPFIPRLLAQGTLPTPIEHLHHYIIIQPQGQHLALTGGDHAETDAALVCQVMKHVCEAMRFAYENLRLLHRDISHGNIVHVGGQGCLIDWHVAYPQQATCFTDRITGTPLFTSHRLHFPNHPHTLLDDLESLLYVLIYVATEGYLPWAHSPDKVMDALKKWHLGEDSEFDQLLKRCVITLRSRISQLRAILFVNPLPTAAPHPPQSVLSESSSSSIGVQSTGGFDVGLAVLHQFSSVFDS
jgi:serine/threonine protein kinase